MSDTIGPTIEQLYAALNDLADTTAVERYISETCAAAVLLLRERDDEIARLEAESVSLADAANTTSLRYRALLDRKDAEIAALKVDADRYRAMKARLPQDGSRGQMDAWNDMRVDLMKANQRIEQLTDLLRRSSFQSALCCCGDHPCKWNGITPCWKCEVEQVLARSKTDPGE